jgi:hypothetical protein
LPSRPLLPPVLAVSTAGAADPGGAVAPEITPVPTAPIGSAPPEPDAVEDEVVAEDALGTQVAVTGIALD